MISTSSYIFPLKKAIHNVQYSFVRYSRPFKKKWGFSTHHGSHSNEIALEYFDFAYPLIFHRHWPSIRLALLSTPKPIALINPYSVNENVKENLKVNGALDMLRFSNEKLINEHHQIQLKIAENDQEYKKRKMLEQQKLLENSENENVIIEDEKETIKQQNQIKQTDIDFEEDLLQFNQPEPALRLDEIYNQALEEQMKINIKGNVVPIIENDKEILIPPSLHAYAYPRSDVTKFEPSKIDQLGLLDYYCMDGACVLPVLALDVQPFQNVLDICAAPGGKALNIFFFCPYLNLTCNDLSYSRWKRLHEVFKLTLPKDVLEKVKFSKRDARAFGTDLPNTFDRVLVDVPCTTDRHALLTEFNIFSKRRIKERVDLPEYQRAILESAIKTCKPGGVIVYSTCSLAPAQNDGVVERAIENVYAKKRIKCQIISTKNIEKRYSYFFEFYQHSRYGTLVLPHISNNFGPLYFVKIRRIS